MPWWAWVFLVAVPAWEILRLSRAYKTGQTKFGAIVYARAADPFGFWFFVFADSLAAIFVGALLLLLVAKKLFGL